MRETGERADAEFTGPAGGRRRREGGERQLVRRIEGIGELSDHLELLRDRFVVLVFSGDDLGGGVALAVEDDAPFAIRYLPIERAIDVVDGARHIEPGVKP